MASCLTYHMEELGIIPCEIIIECGEYSLIGDYLRWKTKLTSRFHVHEEVYFYVLYIYIFGKLDDIH